jgi:hypothetical protein
VPQGGPERFVGRAFGEVLGELFAEDLVLADDEVLFGGEVAEEGAFLHAGRCREVVDGGFVIPLFDEQRLGQLRQFVADCPARAFAH